MKIEIWIDNSKKLYDLKISHKTVRLLITNLGEFELGPADFFSLGGSFTKFLHEASFVSNAWEVYK